MSGPCSVAFHVSLTRMRPPSTYLRAVLERHFASLRFSPSLRLLSPGRPSTGGLANPTECQSKTRRTPGSISSRASSARPHDSQMTWMAALRAAGDSFRPLAVGAGLDLVAERPRQVLVLHVDHHQRYLGRVNHEGRVGASQVESGPHGPAPGNGGFLTSKPCWTDHSQKLASVPSTAGDWSSCGVSRNVLITFPGTLGSCCAVVQ